MIKIFNVYTVFIILVLILLICNLIALLVYYVDGGIILSYVSTAISIVLGLVAICISVVSNSDAANSLSRANEKLVEIKTEMGMLYKTSSELNDLFKRMDQLNENFKNSIVNDNNKEIVEKQKNIDTEFDNIRNSFKNYSGITKIL